MTLVKHDQILSSFNQAYYYTNYSLFSVVKCYYNSCFIVFRDFMTLFNMIKFCHNLTKPIIARIIVSLVFKNIIVRAAVLFSDIL